jgi:hypothetical protein
MFVINEGPKRRKLDLKRVETFSKNCTEYGFMN